ncbi:uncharacterized protein PV06_06487 [Exophiala oligosperma]|uniref:Rhodopsin domain-containing protein n=1 Tax=Exophiala oligosperma TaxID=215243 RepID=A0A0D2DJ79_9EURO|nr:uncharacterized protein PV06_06487 [Exophiala oligosperma]KIW42998.1 hypothetical protein PV06_06487 [Exophiala oligosperma]
MSGTQAVGNSMTFSAVALVFVLLRCTSRIFFVGRVLKEDMLICVAMLWSFGFSSSIEVERQNGMGDHISNVSPERLERMLQGFYASVIVYNLGLAFAKCSISCQFLSLFKERKYRISAWFLIAFFAAYDLVTLMVSIFSCTPVRYYWNRSLPGGGCIRFETWWFFSASFCIVSDFVLCILPLPMLKSLHIPRKQKYSLLAVFAVGGFVCIVAILRLHAVYVISSSPDPTYGNVAAAYWSSIELNTGIICASLPTIRPIIAKIFPTWLGSAPHRVAQRQSSIP